MSASSSRLIAITAVMAGVLCSPIHAQAVDKPPGATPPAPTDCRAVYEGSVVVSGPAATYQAGAMILCGRPGNIAPYGAGNAYSVSDPAPDGTPCQVLYYAPVTFQNRPT